MSWKQKLLFYLYGTPHIAGSSLAILGLLLYFLGVIGAFWWAIVAGLYIAGVAIVPRSHISIQKLNQEASIEEIRRSLNELIKSVKGEVSAVVSERIESIVQSIEDVLPRLEDANAPDHAVFTIREMALSYLPETINNYLQLPRAYARLHPVHKGKTSRELLLEQLAILDEEMKQVTENLNQENVANLEAHGKFLESRFRRSEDFLT